jgi:hypothetical protein
MAGARASGAIRGLFDALLGEAFDCIVVAPKFADRDRGYDR